MIGALVASGWRGGRRGNRFHKSFALGSFVQGLCKPNGQLDRRFGEQVWLVELLEAQRVYAEDDFVILPKDRALHESAMRASTSG